MVPLHYEQCTPVRKNSAALNPPEIQFLRVEIPAWQLSEQNGSPTISRTFKFRNFSQALEFTIKVGQAAEEQDHHPSILTEWGSVTVTWWTHVIAGLHRNDFIMAARTDQLYNSLQNTIQPTEI